MADELEQWPGDQAQPERDGGGDAQHHTGRPFDLGDAVAVPGASASAGSVKYMSTITLR